MASFYDLASRSGNSEVAPQILGATAADRRLQPRLAGTVPPRWRPPSPMDRGRRSAVGQKSERLLSEVLTHCIRPEPGYLSDSVLREPCGEESALSTQALLSEDSANTMENLACRIAERKGGAIAANDLMPYLPVSLGLVSNCLDAMVDGAAVLSEKEGARTIYHFTAFGEASRQEGMLATLNCLACDADLPSRPQRVFCEQCRARLRQELNVLAERIGWPAQAVYEHEILYLAAMLEPPLTAETLAGHSSYTLRNMKRKLDKLTVDGYAEQRLDENSGHVVYRFPEASYPRPAYRENMRVIREYPASVMEEMELRLVRILFSLAMLIVGLFVLAVFHVTYPILFLLFILAAPAIVIGVWRHRKQPEED